MESSDPNAGRRDTRRGGGISLQTLIVASAASAAASFAVSRIWGPGTLISAAATPVIVALVSEFLRRPVQTVSATAKKAPLHMIPAARERDAKAIRPTADLSDIDYYQAGAWRLRWRMAVITGLVAFAIVVGVYTIPDLLAGHSVTGSGHSTTFFGGAANRRSSPTTTTSTTTTPRLTTTGAAPTTSTTKTLTSTGTTSVPTLTAPPAGTTTAASPAITAPATTTATTPPIAGSTTAPATPATPVP